MLPASSPGVVAEATDQQRFPGTEVPWDRGHGAWGLGSSRTAFHLPMLPFLANQSSTFASPFADCKEGGK
jgi:hypothetical protein